MNLREFRALTANFPDDVELVLPAPDHSYERVSGVDLVEAEVFGAQRKLLEYAGAANLSSAASPIAHVVLVS